jgi:hypothetical protein
MEASTYYGVRFSNEIMIRVDTLNLIMDEYSLFRLHILQGTTTTCNTLTPLSSSSGSKLVV